MKVNDNFLKVFFDANIDTITWFAYVLAAILFIQGLRLMNSPRTARKGNFVSIAGMSIAVFFAFVHSLYTGFANYTALFALVAGVALGAVGGVISARRVKMTAMPQLVSIFNTVGGGAAALVAINDAISTPIAKIPASGLVEGVVDMAHFQKYALAGKLTAYFTPNDTALTGHVSQIALFFAFLGIVIGCVTFSGSIVAAGKLQGVITGAAVKIPGKVVLDVACLVISAICGIMIVSGQSFGVPVWVLILIIAVLSLVLGISFALPIGGADMPVVISILNACTGTAVAMSGFVIDNVVMIVAGALVGASGAILSVLMAKAMNRSLISVLMGGFGGGDDAASAGDQAAQVTKETSADDVAVQMCYASKVIIVPGYGLAVAGAQHEIADLANLLEEKGVEVLFAIHPVAGRMPGHMNVLLAEANISYDKLIEMDDINPQFSQADVAFVVGANDVTNPAARRAGTPISGMPILDVDAAKSVVVNKRGRGKGYAGIENELYGLPQTSMLYGDAKDAIAQVIAAVKEL
jgi:NAD(P) transhydrogenase subunit beta